MTMKSCYLLLTFVLLQLSWNNLEARIPPRHRYNRRYFQHPIILVPGLLASKLYVRHESTSQIPGCPTIREKTLLYLDDSDAIPILCRFYYMIPQYNHTSKIAQNLPGVMIETEEFGKVSGVEHPAFTPAQWWPSYFGPLVEFLLRNGYIRDYDLRGAPYDFRLIGAEPYMSNYFENLTKEIQNLRDTIGKKVVLISHSMGGTIIRQFLLTKPQPWKDEYIKNWISLSAPFAGSFAWLLGGMFGDPSGRWKLGPHFKRFIASLPSTKFLFPSQMYFDENKVLFKSPKSSYSLKNVSELLRQNDEENYNNMNNLTIPEVWSNTPLGVGFICITSIGVPTVTSANIYNATTFKGAEVDVNNFGDGILSKEELGSCSKLVVNNTKASTHRTYRSIDHSSIISNIRVMNFILRRMYH